MLIIARKKDEAVMINNKITVKVVAIQGDKVRLGFEAPKRVPILRKEVWERLQKRPKPPSSGKGKNKNRI